MTSLKLPTVRRREGGLEAQPARRWRSATAPPERCSSWVEHGLVERAVAHPADRSRIAGTPPSFFLPPAAPTRTAAPRRPLAPITHTSGAVAERNEGHRHRGLIYPRRQLRPPACRHRRSGGG